MPDSIDCEIQFKAKFYDNGRWIICHVLVPKSATIEFAEHLAALTYLPGWNKVYDAKSKASVLNFQWKRRYKPTFLALICDKAASSCFSRYIRSVNVVWSRFGPSRLLWRQNISQ